MPLRRMLAQFLQLLVIAVPTLASSAGAPFLRGLSSVTSASWNNCHRKQPGKEALAQLPRWNGNLGQFFDEYRQLKDIEQFVDILQVEYPGLVKVQIIGNSWQGRPLRMLEITNHSVGNAMDKTSLVIEGGIHAREWIATSTVLFIVYSLLQEAGTPAVSRLLRDYVVSAAAPVNPDGYVHTWETDRMWRKTRSNRPASCTSRHRDGGVTGVDANRNWGYTWGITMDPSYKQQLDQPCSDVYIGPEAFSEPEVRAVADYMIRRQQHSFARRTGSIPGPGYVAAFLDYHSYAQVLLPPWAYTAETPRAPDGEYQTGLTATMVGIMASTSARTFKAGADEFPPDPGTGPDWAYGYLGIRATMTVELEGSPGGFCLPQEHIYEVGKEQYAAFLAMVRYLRLQGDAPSTQIGLYSKDGAATDYQVKAMASPITQAASSFSGTLLVTIALFLSLSSFVLYRRWAHSSTRQLIRTTSEASSTAPSWAGDISPTSAVQIGRFS